MNQIITILNNFHTHNPLDALLFYVYDVGFVLENSIANISYGKGKADRGQS